MRHPAVRPLCTDLTPSAIDQIRPIAPIKTATPIPASYLMMQLSQYKIRNVDDPLSVCSGEELLVDLPIVSFRNMWLPIFVGKHLPVWEREDRSRKGLARCDGYELLHCLANVIGSATRGGRGRGFGSG